MIRLTEMFNGKHPMLTQAYSPLTIRFFILQSHYRGTLDFGNDALQASEKAMKRLMEATVRCGLVMAWRLAGAPILRSPLSRKPTTPELSSIWTLIGKTPRPSPTALARISQSKN